MGSNKFFSIADKGSKPYNWAKEQKKNSGTRTCCCNSLSLSLKPFPRPAGYLWDQEEPSRLGSVSENFSAWNGLSRHGGSALKYSSFFLRCFWRRPARCGESVVALVSSISCLHAPPPMPPRTQGYVKVIGHHISDLQESFKTAVGNPVVTATTAILVIPD